MFFWHIGATVGFVRYAFRDEAMDLRYLALGALLPDLIDVPPAVVMWTSWQAPRLAGHSLLFGSMIMVVVLIATTRGTRRKQWMLVSVGALMHLALDAMWSDPDTLWWPFLGWEFTSTGFATFPDYARSVLTDPWMWAGEVIGLAYLVHLWRASGLYSATARKVLRSTGQISAPIERT